MNILNIMQCSNLGGMEQSSIELMRQLKNKGHSISVISVHPFGLLEDQLHELKIAAIDCHYRGPYGLFSHFQLRSKIDKHKDAGPIIMTGPTLSGILALTPKRNFPRILMCHFHHQGVHSTYAWKKLYELAITRFDLITYPSKLTLDEAISILPELKRKGIVVRNPIKLATVNSITIDKGKARKMLSLDPSRPVIGNAGWLIQRKRFDVFLHVCKIVKDIRPDCQFVISGDGPLLEKLKKLHEELGLNGFVHFTGWQKSMENFYKSLDVLCFNSDWDSMGMTPLEAVAQGIPVVASVLNGGLKEVFDSRCGILTDSHDIQFLADQCIMILNNPQKARSISNSCLEFAVDYNIKSSDLNWINTLFEKHCPKGEK